MSGSTSRLKATIVQAGAGTGKTQSLAQKIIDSAKVLYDRKNETPRFVATTFTERATSELRERVVSLLSKEENVPTWLSDFVQDTENLHISTIHGTLSLFLHRYGSLLGLDPDFAILKSAEEKEWLSQILRKVISENVKYGAVLDLYSFSETVDFARRLIPHYSLHKENLSVALGWEDLFRAELKELLVSLQELSQSDTSVLPPKAKETFETLSKLNGHLIANSSDLSFCRDVFLDVIDGLRKPSGGKVKEFENPLNFIFDTIRKNWKKDKYSTDLNQRHDEIAPLFQSLVVQAADLLSATKKERGLMSFNDLEFLAQELVVKHPEILDSWRDQWDFWFIDEFQDTSPLQKDILFNFFKKPWNAYFVGDPQQSIYLFRGADENVFQETKRIVAEAGGAVERLAVNYRSNPDLMDFLNLVFSKLKKPVDQLEAREKPIGEIRAHIHIVSKEIDEGDIALEQIKKWLASGVSFQDMAILVRKNSKARVIGQKLGQFGVPVYVHSSGGFYDRREILDALGLLTFLEDPSDDQSFIIIARSPWLGISDLDLAQWGKLRKKMTYWEWLSSNEDEKNKNPNLKILEKAINDCENLPLSQVFSKILDDLGFWEFCLVGDSSGRREANLRKFVWSFRRAEESPQFSAVKFIDEAWEEILDVGEETEAATFIEPERVNIMTVHKSKGLKFNYVIIPSCGDPFKPLESALELAPDGQWSMRVVKTESEEKVGPLMHGKLRDNRVERELAESMRVFYVAITRAAEEISLIGKTNGGETSWYGQVDIPFTEGTHAHYDVKVWNEPPVLEKLTPKIESREIKPIRLIKKLPTAASEIVTVTGIVQNQQGHKFSSRIEQLDSQEKGQAVHSIFEHLKKTGIENIQALCVAASERFLLKEEIKAELIEKTLNLSEPPVKELIKSGFTEWPFIIKDNGHTVKGQIDLWGEVNGETWIVDYKSFKKFNEDNLTSAKEQLELYALAVHKNRCPMEQYKTGRRSAVPISSQNF